MKYVVCQYSWEEVDLLKAFDDRETAEAYRKKIGGKHVGIEEVEDTFDVDCYLYFRGFFEDEEVCISSGLDMEPNPSFPINHCTVQKNTFDVVYAGFENIKAKTHEEAAEIAKRLFAECQKSAT